MTDKNNHINKFNIFKKINIIHHGNKFYIWANRIVFLTNFATLSLLIWKYQTLPKSIPLWYSRPWGTDRLSDSYFIFILPAISLTIHLINIGFTTFFSAEYTVFNKILFITSIFSSVILNFTAVKILSLVM